MNRSAGGAPSWSAAAHMTSVNQDATAAVIFAVSAMGSRVGFFPILKLSSSGCVFARF